MITKILLTLGVIVACMMVLSARAKPQLKRVPNPATERNRKLMRNSALAFMVVMALAAGIMTPHLPNTDNGGTVVSACDTPFSYNPSRTV